jgi:hypothetical protein
MVEGGGEIGVHAAQPCDGPRQSANVYGRVRSGRRRCGIAAGGALAVRGEIESDSDADVGILARAASETYQRCKHDSKFLQGLYAKIAMPCVNTGAILY